MEEDSEVLDWGNEDDEMHMSESVRAQKQSDAWASGDPDEAEDAVSLGGDDDEEVYPSYASASQDDFAKGQSNTYRQVSSSQQQQQTPSTNGRREQRENSSSQKPPSRKNDSSPLRRSQSIGKLTHALPPKPAVAPPPFIHSPPVQRGTLASSMIYRERRSNGQGKPASSQDLSDYLPPDWEVRYPRNGGREAYYYNVRTHESTWTRPGPTSSGRSSPSKERDSDIGGGRISRAGMIDDSTLSIRREERRPNSPGGSLTYEDRHYRPGEQVSSNGPELGDDRRESYPPSPRVHARAMSPRGINDRLAARSVTPPARKRDSRSMEQTGRDYHRDVSPSVAEPNTWRDLPRDAVQAQHSPVLERAWGRSRNNLLPEDTLSRISDDRSIAPRGRRRRSDVEPPLQPLSILQDSHNHSNSEWPASRHRSPPPHLRERSPPRRYATPLDLPERPASPPVRQKNRPEHPVSPALDRDPIRLPDIYIPSDTVPQRRGRDVDPDYGNDPKRRRMDDSVIASGKPRHEVEDRALPPFLPDRPLSQPAQSEQSRPRKRQPLPPQSARFREAARNPALPSIPPVLPPPPVNTLLGDVPSGPRSQNAFPPPRDQDVDRGIQSSSRRSTALGRTPSRTSMRPDDTPARSYSTPYNDRPQPESQMSTLPTGPRAMARNTGAPVQPSRNPPFNAPPNVVNMTGPPKGPDGWSATPNARSRDLPVRRNLMGLPEGPKGFEDDRGHGVDTRTETARDLGVTHYPDGPSGVAKLSGTNIVPVAKKRAFAPVSTPESTLPMMDRAWRPPRSMPPDPVERGYEPMSPTHRYHSPPPVIESTNRRMTLSAREDIALPSERTPQIRSETIQLSSQPSQRSREPRGPSSGRTSRFGPEASEPSVESFEPRIWMTREEHLENSLRAEQQREGDSRVSTSLAPRGTPSASSWVPSSHDAEDGRAPTNRYNDTSNSTRRSMNLDEAMRRPQAETTPPVRDRDSQVDSRRRARPSAAQDRPPSSLSQNVRGDDFRETPPHVSASTRGGGRGRHYPDEPPRMQYGDSWVAPRPSHDERIPQSWDRSGEPAKESGLLHPDRARMIQPATPPYATDTRSLSPVPREDSPLMKSSKQPIRIRRPAKSPQEGPMRFDDMSKAIPPQRPPVQRGGSLLDRLSLSSPPSGSAPLPSLRERVEVPMKRMNEEIAGLPPRPSVEVTQDAEANAGGFDSGPRGGRGRRRSGKPKKGRR